MKRIISLILSFLMLITLLPSQSITVFAEETADIAAELFNLYTPAEEFSFNPYFYRIDSYIGDSTVVRIPPEIDGVPVKEISGKAFYKNENITMVVVPEGVEIIGSEAFYGCTTLSSIEFPDSLTYIGTNTIDNTAFFDNLDNWSNYCLYIGPYLMGIDTVSFNDGGISIAKEIRIKTGTRLVAGMNSGSSFNWMAERLYLPKSIEYIGVNSLKTGLGRYNDYLAGYVNPVNQKEHTNLGYIGKYLIGDGKAIDDELVNVDIKPGTEVIPEAYFYKNGYIRSVVTPESLKRIPHTCFAYSSGLVKARLPYVEIINNSAFASCTNLMTVQLSENLTELGDGAFGNCQSLDFIEIFGNLKTISSYSFGGCTSLNNIVIHKGVEKIEEYAFEDCTALSDIYYTGSEEDWNKIEIEALAFYGAKDIEEITIHYNHVPTKRSYEDPIYIPETINEVTITGKGTAYGKYRVYDLWGNPAKNMLVEYTVNGEGNEKTYADENGFIEVNVKGIEEDADYTIGIGGVGIAPQEGTLSVKVEPLTFKADYEAVFTKGANVGVGIGVGGSVGELEADASIAEVGVSGSVARGISVSQEYVGGKHKLTVSSKQNLEGALEAKAGLFAGVETDLGVNVKASVGDVYGEGSVGSVAGVSFEVDDFDVNDKDDVDAVAKFVLCAILDTMGSNVVAREIIERLGFEINAYEAGNTASLSAGANLGVVGIEGDYADAGVTLGGVDAFSVWSNSTKTFSDGAVEYTSSLKAGTDGKVFDFDVKTSGDSNVSIGETVFTPEKISNDVMLSAERDQSGALVDLSLVGTDTQNNDILWNKSSTESKYVISYPSESVENITHQDWNIYSFSQGSKAFFSVEEWENAVGVMLNSGEKAKYNTSKAVTQGFDLSLSASVKLLAEIGGKIGFSGIESYEYASSNGIYENGEVFIQSSNDIADEVADKVVTVDELMEMAEEKIKEELSELLEVVKDKVNGVIDAGKSKLENIGDGISAAIKKTKEDLAPAAVLTAELMEDGSTDVSELITVGNPCIITTHDANGNEITDFSSSPMLLTLGYTDAELSASEVSDTSRIKLMRWDDDLCVYVVLDAQHNEEDMSFSAEITKPGQYVLACDTIAPKVISFAYNSDNANPTLGAYVSDVSGISEFTLFINDESVVDTQKFYDYYDSTSGQFSYPLSDYEDGGYWSSITVADAFGNTTEEWADFEIYREAPEITDVVIPEALNPSGEIRANVSSMDELSGVYLNVEYTDEEGNTASQYSKMTERYDGEADEYYYTSLFPEIEAEKDVTVWIKAYNMYGNCAESEKVSATTAPVAIEIDEVLKGCVSVVCNNKNGLENVSLYAAAYDENGAFLKAQVSAVSDNVFFTGLPEGAVIKAYLWQGMKPLCEQAVYTVSAEE